MSAEHSAARSPSDPVFQRLYRWHESNPQYDVGHQERIDDLEAILPDGLCVTGSAYRGIGIPDCVRQAQETAQQIIEPLTETG